jgi:branched-chain amino acid transport system permease protein
VTTRIDAAVEADAAGRRSEAPAARTARRSTVLDRPLLALALAAALAAPQFLHSAYWLRILILMCIFAVVNQSWNLIMGYAGIWSFAQLALFVLGGYTTALLGKHYGVSPYLGTLAGGLAAVLASLVIGLPSLRLKGAYVFLLTLGFHEFFRNLFILDTSQKFGGQYGLSGYGKWNFGGATAVERLTRVYYVALVLLIVTGLVIWKILHSPLGLAFRALRDSEPYAVSRGVPEYRFKLIVFAISAFFTGLAGAFYAHYIGSISPNNLDFGDMMNRLTMIVVGGWGTFWGPIVGTVAVRYFDERLRDIDQWRVLIFGVAIVAFVIFLPEGLVGPLGRLKNRAAVWVEDRLPRRARNRT